MPHNKLFQLLVRDLPVSIPVDHLDVRRDVGGGGLELLVHGSVAVAEPLGDLD